MNNDFVYKQTLKLAIENGANEATEKKCASNCVDDYAKGRIDKKVLDLIEKHVKIACSLTDKQRLKTNKVKRKKQIQEDMF